MKKLYLCEQQSNETVQAFTTRLEDLYDKAVNLTALRRLDIISTCNSSFNIERNTNIGRYYK